MHHTRHRIIQITWSKSTHPRSNNLRSEAIREQDNNSYGQKNSENHLVGIILQEHKKQRNIHGNPYQLSTDQPHHTVEIGIMMTVHCQKHHGIHGFQHRK